MTYNFDEIMLYLDDINNYVNSILYYHSCDDKKRNELYLNEILMYLSSVSEIIQDIKDYLYYLYCSKN